MAEKEGTLYKGRLNEGIPVTIVGYDDDHSEIVYPEDKKLDVKQVEDNKE